MQMLDSNPNEDNGNQGGHNRGYGAQNGNNQGYGNNNAPTGGGGGNPLDDDLPFACVD